ncbi:MYND finger family [Fusarium albosuccineum]|uniref:MYND finger family n=1 Tax=Fusarium albosuccineum TaxID=1237068 RepID=A0A8H4P768_9HYPO|nr:MYND finger family [Fusarium albosuccineum]
MADDPGPSAPFPNPDNWSPGPIKRDATKSFPLPKRKSWDHKEDELSPSIYDPDINDSDLMADDLSRSIPRDSIMANTPGPSLPSPEPGSQGSAANDPDFSLHLAESNSSCTMREEDEGPVGPPSSREPPGEGAESSHQEPEVFAMDLDSADEALSLASIRQDPTSTLNGRPQVDPEPVDPIPKPTENTPETALKVGETELPTISEEPESNTPKMALELEETGLSITVGELELETSEKTTQVEETELTTIPEEPDPKILEKDLEVDETEPPTTVGEPEPEPPEKTLEAEGVGQSTIVNGSDSGPPEKDPEEDETKPSTIARKLESEPSEEDLREDESELSTIDNELETCPELGPCPELEASEPGTTAPELEKPMVSTEESQETENNTGNSRLLRLVEPVCPARKEDGGFCGLLSENIACPRCLLVGYCSEKCRKEHWEAHRPGCIKKKSQKFDESMEKLVADAERGTQKDGDFWAKYPAVDLLNLNQTEGNAFDGVLNLLLAGGSTLRHVLYTIALLPPNANPTLRFALNELTGRDLAHLIWSLVLLTEVNSSPTFLAEAVIHLWYSARLPYPMLQYALQVLSKSIEDLAEHVKKHSGSRSETFPFSIRRANCVIVLELSAENVAEITSWINPPPPGYDTHVIRVLDRQHCEPVSQAVSRMTPARVCGLVQWKTDGMLLPYGYPRDDFTEPNPLFFSRGKPYPRTATTEPLSEWPAHVLDQKCGPAVNDVYGKVFYHLRHVCLSFQTRMKSLRAEFTVTKKNLSELPGYFNKRDGRKFDRIEAGPFFDKVPLMTMAILGHLLQHIDINPHATLLTTTRKSVCHELESVRNDLEQEVLDMHVESGTPLDKLAPPLGLTFITNSPEAVRREIGLLMWRNWDKFSNVYLHAPHYFGELAKYMYKDCQTNGITTTCWAGLQFKQKNTVCRPWPNRLVYNRNDDPTLQDFNRWLGWGDNKPVQWLEWKRTGDVDTENCVLWHTIALKEEEHVNTKPDEDFGVTVTEYLALALSAKTLILASRQQENGAKRRKEDGSSDMEMLKGETVAEKPKKKSKKKKKKKKGAAAAAAAAEADLEGGDSHGIEDSKS